MSKIIQVKVEKIIPSLDNPRIINEKSASFLELVESVKAVGVMIPVHIRSHPERAGMYQLLAGQRRWQAANAAEMETITAIDHGSMNDAGAFEVTYFENYCRDDLSPLEEGKAVKILLEKYGGDHKAVASKMGKSCQWVHLRGNMFDGLSKESRMMLTVDLRFADWTAGHFELIARFDADTQAKILKSLKKTGHWISTINQLSNFLTDYLQLLKSAAFDTKKCEKCTKRSSAQPMLWVEDASKATGKNDRCLDVECFKSKNKAHFKAKLADAKKENPELLIVGDFEYWNIPAAARSNFGSKYAAFSKDFAKAKKGDKAAVQAMVVDANGVGHLRWIKVTKEAAKKAKTEKAAYPTIKAAYPTIAELRAELIIRRKEKLLELLAAYLSECEIGGGSGDEYTGRAANGLMLYVLQFGLDDYGIIRDDDHYFTNMSNEKIAQRLLDKLRDQFSEIEASIEVDNQWEWSFIQALAGWFDFKIDAAMRSIEEMDEFKEPAEWDGIDDNAVVPEPAKAGDK